MSGKRITKSSILMTQIILLHGMVVYYAFADETVPVGPTTEITYELDPTQPRPATQSTETGTSTQSIDATAATALLPGTLDYEQITSDGNAMQADLANGWSAELTLVPTLQKKTESILRRAKGAFAAVAMIDVTNDNVLVLADQKTPGHVSLPAPGEEGEPSHLTLRPIAPAASVFKIVTSAALLKHGVRSKQTYAYTRAVRRIGKAHLAKPAPNANRSTVGKALADSNNGFFARVSDMKITRDQLVETATDFGFNRVIPFPLLTGASAANIPRNRLERARMSAGFWHSTLTPLHAALIASAVAGDGELPTPRFVTRLHGPQGQVIDAPARRGISRAMTPEVAGLLRKAMGNTVTKGTARRAFSRWPKKLSHIKVGGKTGSLAKRSPYTSYTWFVGYAPVDNPQVAIAVLVGNGEKWWQKAADVARDVLASYFTHKAKNTLANR